MKGGKGSGGSNMGAMAAGGALGLAADGGYGNIGCPSSDTSFYCQLSRSVKIIQMILLLLIIFGSISYLLYFFYNMKKSKK